jgi:hypothetical protein
MPATARAYINKPNRPAAIALSRFEQLESAGRYAVGVDIVDPSCDNGWRLYFGHYRFPW